MKKKSSNKSINAATLQHLSFEHSSQPQFITNNTSGKIILVNHAACQLLGYNRRELLTKRRATLFNLKESHFKELLYRPSDPVHPLSITVIRKNGRPVHCEITGALFNAPDGTQKAILSLVDIGHIIRRQEEIDSGKEKTVADNIALTRSMQKIIDIKKEQRVIDDIILALAKSDARLAENNEWKKYIGKTSYDVMWDWEIGSEQIYVSDSLLEVFGYKVKNNTITFSAFGLCLLPEEKDRVEKRLAKVLSSDKKNWSESFMFKSQNGSLAATTSRASIVRNKQGKALRLIGAIQDVSRLHELEKRLKNQIILQKELSEIFLVASKLSFDGRWDWNLITDEFFFGEGFKELFGYDSHKHKGQIRRDWSKNIHPDDREAVENGLRQAIASTAAEWEHAYRFIKADGTIARVFNRASLIRNTEGKACRIIGIMQDISKQKNLEEQLEREIRTKNKQIAEATEEAKETERSDIGKELHDNINQLLGVSKLYLDMAKKGGEESGDFITRSSEYTMSAIEEIRKLTKGLTTGVIQYMGLCQAIENIAHEAMQVGPVKITCSLTSFTEESVGDKFKLNVFRIIQEQLNNILKHAKATKVTIWLFQNKKRITLDIADNGVGFDTRKAQLGIGVENIKNRVAAYEGVAEFISAPGKGCQLTATFPITPLLL